MCCNPDGPTVDEENYIECPAFEGMEKYQPRGCNFAIEGMVAEDFVLEGSIKKLKASGVIMDCAIDEEVYQQIVATYGLNFMQLGHPTGGKNMTRPEWKAEYGSDGLKLYVLAKLREGAKGGKGGVTAHPR
jgi:hypothetical protein